MTDQCLGPLISGDEIASELRSRKNKDVYKKVSGLTKKRIAEKVKLEEADGWHFVKKLANSTRMGKSKPADEQFEDEVWSILARMGFKEMSLGRKFKINVGRGLEPRQIDVFAKDDETVVLVECTQSDTPGKKTQRISSLIEKLCAIRGDILKSIQAHYGNTTKLKVRPVIATRNINWGEADKNKCDEAQILLLTDSEIEYYNRLVSLYKTAARYQFLAHAFGGFKIEGLRQVVHATKGTMGGTPYYTFHIKPDDLLKTSYIGHKSSRTADDLATYQRLVVPKRLKEIAKYINDGGKFPTNIVVNIKTKKGTSLSFNSLGKIGEDVYGELTLPPIYGSAWVIDGQHRLYGYAYAREPDANGFADDRTTLPVLAFENLGAKEEMKLFADINSKQVNVKRDLLEEIHADLFWKSSDPERGFNALLSRIPAELNSSTMSPLHERMKSSAPGKSRKTPSRCLTLTSLRDGLDDAELAGSLHKGSIHHGPFVTGVGKDYTANLEKCVFILSSCLNVIRDTAPDHWKLGDAPGGYLCTNNGIRATFLLLKALCDHIESKTGESFFKLSAEDVSAKLTPYLKVLAKHFDGASTSQVSRIRTGVSSKSAVVIQKLDLAEIIWEQIPDFSPRGLKEHIEARDMDGTERARTIIDNISLTLNNFMRRILKEKYGKEHKDWWAPHIPVEVMTKASKRRDEDKWANLVETYVDLGDYRKIANANWELMGSVFALGDKNVDDKKKVTNWIDKLVRIRRTTHHPEKGAAKKDEVQFVDDVLKKVQAHFPEEDLSLKRT